jgi:hypothetical protein
MKSFLFWCIIVFVLVLTPYSVVRAEDIKNFSECEVCPGNIHFGPNETRGILGKPGFSMISEIENMSASRKIYLDLDGKFEPFAGKKAPEGYELKVSRFPKTIYIEHIGDESYIQLVTGNPGKSFDRWFPELYLQSASSEKIGLEDPLEFAWAKMEKSLIWQWAASENVKTPAKSLSSKQLVFVLEILAGAK